MKLLLESTLRVLRHILKELGNDPLFQLRKVVKRVDYKIKGIFNLPAVISRSNEIKGVDVVTYTLGKSGSSSINYTLMNRYPFRKIFHVHFLSDYWIKEVFPGTPHERNIHKAEDYFAYKAKKPNNITKYIALVREPIGRDISGFFQNYRLMNMQIDKDNLESIRQQIYGRGHDLALNWFDTDFFNYTGYDIFKTPFDKTKGYQIYKIDNQTELLIIRTDKLSMVFTKAMKEYIGVTFDKLINFNLSKNKKDGFVIKALKSYYYEEENDLDLVYNSKFMRHFFNDKEIAEYRQKWTKNEAK